MEPDPFGGPPLDAQLRVCSDGADWFVTNFYRDVNAANSLAAYYIDASTLYAAANESADIVVNGAKLHSSAEYEALLDEQCGGNNDTTTNNNNNNNNNNATNGHSRRSTATATTTSKHPRVRYEVDSFDAQPINYDFQIAMPSILPQPETAYGGGCISMLVSVMGTLHLPADTDDGEHGTSTSTSTTRKTTFTDAFVLWPNWAARGRGAAARREKHRFLVASQNYRTL